MIVPSLWPQMLIHTNHFFFWFKLTLCFEFLAWTKKQGSQEIFLWIQKHGCVSSCKDSSKFVANLHRPCMYRSREKLLVPSDNFRHK